MAIYAYRCANDHCVERDFAMGTAPAVVPCCECDARRVYGDFQFTEDRTRFFRNPVDGTRFSYSLGMQYPDTRADRDATFTALGCEPVTQKTMPEAWRDAREYAEYKRHGGTPLPNDGYVPPKSKVTVLGQLRAAKNLHFTNDAPVVKLE